MSVTRVSSSNPYLRYQHMYSSSLYLLPVRKYNNHWYGTTRTLGGDIICIQCAHTRLIDTSTSTSTRHIHYTLPTIFVPRVPFPLFTTGQVYFSSQFNGIVH